LLSQAVLCEALWLTYHEIFMQLFEKITTNQDYQLFGIWCFEMF